MVRLVALVAAAEQWQSVGLGRAENDDGALWRTVRMAGRPLMLATLLGASIGVPYYRLALDAGPESCGSRSTPSSAWPTFGIGSEYAGFTAAFAAADVRFVLSSRPAVVSHHRDSCGTDRLG